MAKSGLAAGAITNVGARHNLIIAQNQGHLAHCPFFEIIPKQLMNPPTRAGVMMFPGRPEYGVTTDLTNPGRPVRIFNHTGGSGDRVYSIKASVPESLSFDDAAVYMTVLALASPDDRRIAIEHDDELRNILRNEKSPQETTTLATETNFHEILLRLGWHIDSESYQRLSDSLDRLSFVSFVYTFKGQVWTSSLLGFRRQNNHHTKVLIVINPVSASVILGDRKSAGCVLTDTEELKKLTRQTEKAAYLAIVRLLKPGETTKLRLSLILDYIYRKPATEDQTKKFVQTVKKMETKIPGWKFAFVGRGKDRKLCTTRPLLADQNG
jgi:Replication protein C (RepC)